MCVWLCVDLGGGGGCRGGGMIWRSRCSEEDLFSADSQHGVGIVELSSST